MGHLRMLEKKRDVLVLLFGKIERREQPIELWIDRVIALVS